MKKGIFSLLQRIGRCLMLPIAVLPIAGLFLGVGSSLTNPTTIASMQLEWILGDGTFLHGFLLLLKGVGNILFENIPLLFAASVALGMAKKAKEVAALSSIIAFFVMHASINGMLTLTGVIENNQIVQDVLTGSIANVCGILSLQMGVFGGIIVGLGVSYLHNRFYDIQDGKIRFACLRDGTFAIRKGTEVFNMEFDGHSGYSYFMPSASKLVYEITDNAFIVSLSGEGCLVLGN